MGCCASTLVIENRRAQKNASNAQIHAIPCHPCCSPMSSPATYAANCLVQQHSLPSTGHQHSPISITCPFCSGHLYVPQPNFDCPALPPTPHFRGPTAIPARRGRRNPSFRHASPHSVDPATFPAVAQLDDYPVRLESPYYHSAPIPYGFRPRRRRRASSAYADEFNPHLVRSGHTFSRRPDIYSETDTDYECQSFSGSDSPSRRSHRHHRSHRHRGHPRRHHHYRHDDHHHLGHHSRHHHRRRRRSRQHRHDPSYDSPSHSSCGSDGSENLSNAGNDEQQATESANADGNDSAAENDQIDQDGSNADDDSVNNSGSQVDVVDYISASEMTDEVPGDVAVEDIAQLVLGPPDVVLQRALDRASGIDQMEGAAITQTIFILEEGLKEANKQIERRNLRESDGRKSDSRGRNRNASAAGNIDIAGDNGNDDGNSQGPNGATGAESTNGNGLQGDTSSFADDFDDHSEGSLDDQANGDVVDSVKLAQSYELLARLHASQLNENRSWSRSIDALEKALLHLVSREVDPLMWASIHYDLATTYLKLSDSVEVSILQATTGADVDPTVDVVGTSNGSATAGDDEVRNIKKAVYHAQKALEVYERRSTPTMYANACGTVAEAYTRHADMSPNQGPWSDESILADALPFSAQSDSVGNRKVGCHVCDCLLTAKRGYMEALEAVEKHVDEKLWAQRNNWLAHIALRYRLHLRGLQSPAQFMKAVKSQESAAQYLRLRPSDRESGKSEAGPSHAAFEKSPHKSSDIRPSGYAHERRDSSQRHCVVDYDFGPDAAIDHLQRALDVFVRQGVPVHCANIQQTIGTAYIALCDDTMFLYNCHVRELSGAEEPREFPDTRFIADKLPPAVDRIVRRYLSRAVKAFSESLKLRPWSLNAGYDYSVTMRHRADAAKRLAALPPVDPASHQSDNFEDDSDGADPAS